MNIQRNEIRTGLLAILSLGVFVAVLIYLGAPGVFVPQHSYKIYFDNAAGLKPGAEVLLAGRKVGQVKNLFSPVPEEDRPSPELEVMVIVQVAASAPIYKEVDVTMTQPGLLSEHVIDFTSGVQKSGRAPDGWVFIGERAGGLAEAVPMVLEKLDPVLQKVNTTLGSLQKTADNITDITSPEGELPTAIAEFRNVASNLKDLSGKEGPLHKSLDNVQSLTGPEGELRASLQNLQNLTAPDGSLARTLKNTEEFTTELNESRDIQVTLQNFREASEDLKESISVMGEDFTALGRNLKQGSDTLKRQPWRLIWPTTKKYPEEEEPLQLQESDPKPVVEKSPRRIRLQPTSKPPGKR
jgi:phospholipid/cholesterol/gamma-HCH transport system substrate-binding protein